MFRILVTRLRSYYVKSCKTCQLFATGNEIKAIGLCDDGHYSKVSDALDRTDTFDFILKFLVCGNLSLDIFEVGFQLFVDVSNELLIMLDY